MKCDANDKNGEKCLNKERNCWNPKLEFIGFDYICVMRQLSFKVTAILAVKQTKDW